MFMLAISRIIFSRFIDGTVAGTNINYPDTNSAHDHTYYGFGCDSEWGVGSTVSCDVDLISNLSDTQKIGVYYTFTAAVSGSSTTESVTDNMNAPDTFCPLGWQLPYSGTGGDYYDKSKSWRYLLTQYNYGDNKAGADGLRSYPIAIIDSGLLEFAQGKLFEATINGNYWSETNNTRDRGYRIHTNHTRVIHPQNSWKVLGHSLHCVLIFSIHSPTARWRERT